MNRNSPGIAQGIVNAIWKAMQSLRGGPTPPARPKLDGRRGYGDNEIPTPDRNPDET